MVLYGVNSTEQRTEWFSQLKKAREMFDDEIDWIEGDEISEDDYVNLISVDLQEFYKNYNGEYDVEEEMEEFATTVKTCIWDEDWEQGNPRDDGYDFDYYISRKVIEY